MSKTIQSDDEKRKEAYLKEKAAKANPSFYKRVLFEGTRLTAARDFAYEVNQGIKKTHKFRPFSLGQ